MSQYKVPQNIDMQDRIFGPLTLYQFLYLLATGMVFYATLKTPSVIDLIFIGIPTAILGLCFAFIKINDQPFGRFVISLIFYLTHPKTRVWHHGGGAPMITVNNKDNTTQRRVVHKQLPLDRVKQISGELDNG